MTKIEVGKVCLQETYSCFLFSYYKCQAILSTKVKSPSVFLNKALANINFHIPDPFQTIARTGSLGTKLSHYNKLVIIALEPATIIVIISMVQSKLIYLFHLIDTQLHRTKVKKKK